MTCVRTSLVDGSTRATYLSVGREGHGDHGGDGEELEELVHGCVLKVGRRIFEFVRRMRVKSDLSFDTDTLLSPKVDPFLPRNGNANVLKQSMKEGVTGHSRS